MSESRQIPKSAEWAKVGTVPKLIIRDRRTPLKVGAHIRFRMAVHGSRWEHGVVEGLEPVPFIAKA